MSCIVQGCSTNIEEFAPKGIMLHTFPKARILLRKWLHVLNKDTTAFDWSKDKWICSRHFQEDDYASNKRTLTASAVPSLFLNLEKTSVMKKQRSATKKVILNKDAVYSDSEDDEKNTNNKATVKTCAVASCKNSGLMVRDFPNPEKVCKLYNDYVNMCKNEVLKNMKPEDVISSYGICDDHFKEFTTHSDHRKEFSTNSDPDDKQSLKLKEMNNKIEKMCKPNQLCRLCFKIGSVSLFSNRYYSKSLKDIAKLFIPINFRISDVSIIVCVDCKNELLRFYNFMIKSLEVDEYFQVINKEANNANNSFEDILIIDPLSLVNDHKEKFLIAESTSIKPEGNEQDKIEKENTQNINKFHNYAKLENKPSKSKKQTEHEPKKKIKDKSIICIHCNQIIDIDNLVEHCKVENHDPIFTCLPCREMFKNQDDLKEHTSTHLKHYICEKCGQLFRLRNSLIFHLHKVHNSGDLKFACKECPKKFVSNHQLKAHIRRHTNDKPYACEQCGSTFYSLATLKIHQTIHSGHKPYQCTICDREFRIKYKLQMHIKTHTGENEKFPCKKCEAVYKYERNLERHIRQVHLRIRDTNNSTKKNYNCLICKAVFKGYQAYYKHKMKHSPQKKKFTCTYCNKAFMNSTLLKVHMTVHTGERNFECKICNKKFTQKPHLQTHIFTHTGEKRYKCKFCSKRFVQQAGLTIHERTHTGEKPFVCKFCDKRFGHPTNYKRHVLTQHDVVLPRKRVHVEAVDQNLEVSYQVVIEEESTDVEEENVKEEEEESKKEKGVVEEEEGEQYIFIQEKEEENIEIGETRTNETIELRLFDYEDF